MILDVSRTDILRLLRSEFRTSTTCTCTIETVYDNYVYNLNSSRQLQSTVQTMVQQNVQGKDG